MVGLRFGWSAGAGSKLSRACEEPLAQLQQLARGEGGSGCSRGLGAIGQTKKLRHSYSNWPGEKAKRNLEGDRSRARAAVADTRRRKDGNDSGRGFSTGMVSRLRSRAPVSAEGKCDGICVQPCSRSLSSLPPLSQARGL